MKQMRNLLEKVKANLAEVWATFSILVGLPLSVGLFLGVEAAVATFFVLNSVLGVLAVRNK